MKNKNGQRGNNFEDIFLYFVLDIAPDIYSVPIPFDFVDQGPSVTGWSRELYLLLVCQGRNPVSPGVRCETIFT